MSESDGVINPDCLLGVVVGEYFKLASEDIEMFELDRSGVG